MFDDQSLNVVIHDQTWQSYAILVGGSATPLKNMSQLG